MGGRLSRLLHGSGSLGGDLHRTADLLPGGGAAGGSSLGRSVRVGVSANLVGRRVADNTEIIEGLVGTALGAVLAGNRGAALAAVTGGAGVGGGDGLGTDHPGVGVGSGADGLAIANGGGVNSHLVAAGLGEHPVGVHVRRLFDGDGAREGLGPTVEKGLDSSEGALREQVHLAGALDVADVDLDLVEAIAIDVEGLPAWPQQILVLRDGQQVTPGGTGVPARDGGQGRVLDGKQDVLRGVKHTLAGHVLLDLQVKTVLGS